MGITLSKGGIGMYPPMSQQMVMCDKERRDLHFKRISMPHTYFTF